jgi:hypothetical protein
MVTFRNVRIEDQCVGDQITGAVGRQFEILAAHPTALAAPGLRDFLVTNRPLRASQTKYVVLENNHYITVDETLFHLHSSTVSPIGRAGKTG